MIKKETQIIKVDRDNPKEEKLSIAAEIIRSGGTVAFPTETVYGLGANALDEKAVEKIFIAKGRPQDNPLIVHISSLSQLYPLVKEIPHNAEKLMKKFWPGPLTLLFNKSDKIPSKITAGLPTVAIRMPNHKVALDLIRLSNLPIAAPSANTSGKPSPTNSDHVVEDLFGKIDIILDGGPTGVGLESTVLDVSGKVPVILRPGGITLEDLLEIFPNVEYDPAIEGISGDLVPRAPGQKYKHYSPNARMIIVQGDQHNIIGKIIKLAEEYKKDGLKVGIMATEETKNKYDGFTTLVVGKRAAPKTIAAGLFDTLRHFDKLKVDIIIAEGIGETGIGKAIMNRMKKAAGGEVIR